MRYCGHSSFISLLHLLLKAQFSFLTLTLVPMKIADDGNSLFVQLCLDDIVNSGALRDLLQPQLTLMMIIILAMFRQ